LSAKETFSLLSTIEEYAMTHSLIDTLRYVEKILGEHRGVRVKEAIFENRIVKIEAKDGSIHWFFLGKTGSYIVIPKTFCSCVDFEINVVERKKIPTCYHLVAQVVAEVYDKYRRVSDLPVDEVLRIYDEIEKRQLSATLHKYLLLRR